MTFLIRWNARLRSNVRCRGMSLPPQPAAAAPASPHLDCGASADTDERLELVEVHRGRPTQLSVKVLVPVDDHPNFNFVGKLLGPQGNSLKRLQEATQTRMAILGRGSMRNKKKEEELRRNEDPKHSHLNQALHVDISTFAPAAEAYARIAHALSEIKRFLIPDYHDDIRQQQLRELAFLNGTNRAVSTVPGLSSDPGSPVSSAPASPSENLQIQPPLLAESELLRPLIRLVPLGPRSRSSSHGSLYRSCGSSSAHTAYKRLPVYDRVTSEVSRLLVPQWDERPYDCYSEVIYNSQSKNEIPLNEVTDPYEMAFAAINQKRSIENKEFVPDEDWGPVFPPRKRIPQVSKIHSASRYSFREEPYYIPSYR